MNSMVRLGVIAGILGFLLAASVAGQMSDMGSVKASSGASGLGTRPVSSPFALIDFSRVKWSHSYSVSFFSGGMGSGSAGLFRSSMFYEFSDKLSLSLNVGIAHTGALWQTDARDAVLLPGFVLDYHPSDKFRMTFMVQRVGGFYDPYAHGSSYWRDYLGP